MFESQYNYVPNPYPPRDMQPVYPGPGIPPGPAPGPYPYPPGPYPGPMPAPVQIDASLSIPGAAADAYTTGQLLAAKLGLEKLIGSIQLIDDKLEILGIDTAANGQVPSKGEDGSIEWVDAARESEVTSIKENLQGQINSLSASLDRHTAQIAELFDAHADQDTQIALIREAVDNLSLLINGQDGEPGLLQRVEALEETTSQLTNALSTKLDTSVFEETVNGLDERIRYLESCCQDVQSAIEDLDDLRGRVSSLEDAVEDLSGLEDKLDLKADKADVEAMQSIQQQMVNVLGNPEYYPEYYDQPIFMTLNELRDMNIDGGDIDEEVEP